MITRWKVSNFKSIRKETELEFSPLTIFAGANSSGKSSFLQTVLLVSQTLAHKISSRSVVLNGAFTKLGQFNDLVSSGSGKNPIKIGWSCRPLENLSEEMALSGRLPYYVLRTKNSLSDISCEIAFDANDHEEGTQPEISQIQPLLYSTTLSFTAIDEKDVEKKKTIRIQRAKKHGEEKKKKFFSGENDGDHPNVFRSLEYDLELDSETFKEINDEISSAQPKGCLLNHFLPKLFVLEVNRVVEDAQAIWNFLVGESIWSRTQRWINEREISVPPEIVDRIAPVINERAQQFGRKFSYEGRAVGRILSELYKSNNPNLGETQSLTLYQLGDLFRRMDPPFRMDIRKKLSEDESLESLVKKAVQKQFGGGGDKPAIVSYGPFNQIRDSVWYLERFFGTSIRYLGPLRDEPKSLYPLSPSADPSDVGLKGEHTAAVLEIHKKKLVKYIPTSAFLAEEVDPTSKKETLENAVCDWLQYLGIAENVQSLDRGKFGHEMKVNVIGSIGPHDLTHVGVGVSQILPILVTSLIAPSDTVLIFEQPELHLHPKVQTLLADFFLSMTQLGKQCLLETHSEYLVNRIRLRVAREDLSKEEWKKAVKIYFVEKEGSESSFREVDINEYGAILEWPKGFFDQSQNENEAILRAATLKRKAQKKGGIR